MQNEEYIIELKNVYKKYAIVELLENFNKIKGLLSNR